MEVSRDLPLLAGLVGAFVFAIFIAAAETALLRVSAVRVHAMAAEGSRRARRLVYFVDRISEVLNSVLLAALLAQIGAATLAGILADRWFGPLGVTLVSAVLTFVLFIYAEAIPKTYAVRHPDRVALALAYPLSWVLVVLRPLVRVLVWVADIQMPGKGVATSPTITEAELRMLAARAATEGQITAEDLELIERVFRAGDLRVNDIMVPRLDVVAVDGTTTVAAALQLALDHGHRRLPVYEGTIDNIHAMVKLRELASVPEARRDELTASRIGEPLLVVPESKRVLDLLTDMQGSGTHMAAVVDEYGVTSGLVTVEDIVEEVLGSVSEQPGPEDVVEVGDGHWHIDGSLPIEDLGSLLEADIEDGGSNTASGLVLSLLGRLPRVGDEVVYGGHTIRVTGVRGRRITRLEVRKGS